MGSTNIALLRGAIRPLTYFNPLTKTEGEALAQLVFQRLNTFEDIVPHKAKIWKKGKSMVVNALYNDKGIGIHGHTPYLGSVHPDLMFVAKAITEAQKKTNYAAGHYLGKKDIRRGYDFQIDTAINGVNDPNIYEELRKAGCISVQEVFDERNGTYSQVEIYDPSCIKAFNTIDELNNRFPKSAHHALYNFIANPNAATWTTIAKIKALQHSQLMGEMTRVSDIRANLMKVYQKNCIIWRNSERGAEGIQTPEMVIANLVENPSFDMVKAYEDRDQSKIGEPFTLTVAFVWALVGALVVITGLIQVLKNKEPTAFQYLAGIKTPEFMASGKDHEKDDDDGGGHSCGAGYTWSNTLNKCVKDETDDDDEENAIITWVKDNPLLAGALGLGGLGLGLSLMPSNK